MRDWLGSGIAPPGVNVLQQRRSPLTRAIEAAASDLAQEWDARLGEVLAGLMSHGGHRLAVAEAAVARLIHLCDEATQEHKGRVDAQKTRSAQSQEQLDAALEACLNGGGWNFFGSRSRRLVRVFVDHLAAFARQCLAEDTAAAVLRFFAGLRGRLADRMRDLGFCRQRLRNMQTSLEQDSDGGDADPDNVADTMTFVRNSSSSLGQTPMQSAEAYWESIRESTTNRVVLPDGETDLEIAARHFVDTLTQEYWTQLDQAIGDQVLAPAGGLLKLCLNTHDLVRSFVAPLLSQTITCLSDHLPITDVAQAEFSVQEGLLERIVGYHSSAGPILTHQDSRTALAPPHTVGLGSGACRAVLVGGRGENQPDDPRITAGKKAPGNADQAAFLLIPASEAGKDFGEEARKLLPDLNLVNVPGQADLMFCREQTVLSIDDLERMLHPCRGPIYEMSMAPQSSPHSRFDIQDWAPLDP